MLFSCAALAQIGAAVERASVRAAATAAERQAIERAAKGVVTRTTAHHAIDRVVRRWTSSLCKPTPPCPLDEKTANTFKGGSYDEIILGSDTVLFRAYHQPTRKYGMPGERLSYWSRSDATGTKAAVDSAIEVSRYGNIADRLVSIRVPKGTRVYEGTTQSINKGPIGGGNQVILDRIRPEWEMKP
ncbi:MAG: hypothetical protein ABL857_07435 [Rickettsiales bacterium]|jgi:hypothetical protein